MWIVIRSIIKITDLGPKLLNELKSNLKYGQNLTVNFDRKSNQG